VAEDMGAAAVAVVVAAFMAEALVVAAALDSQEEVSVVADLAEADFAEAATVRGSRPA